MHILHRFLHRLVREFQDRKETPTVTFYIPTEPEEQPEPRPDLDDIIFPDGQLTVSER